MSTTPQQRRSASTRTMNSEPRDGWGRVVAETGVVVVVGGRGRETGIWQKRTKGSQERERRAVEFVTAEVGRRARQRS